MSIAISELYTNPQLRERYNYTWQNRLPIDDMLVLADFAVNQKDPVAYLDALEDTNYEQHGEIKRLITELPAEVIHANYGTEVLAWATVNATFEDTGKKLRQGLETYADFDPVLFEKARLWEWQKHGSSKGKDVLGQYASMEYVARGGLANVDLKKVLTNSARPGVELSPKRLQDYDLLPLRSKESYLNPDGAEKDWYYIQDGSDICWGIWLDAPTGFALTYKGKPNAVIAFAKSGHSELMVYQLQGVQAKRVDLDRIYDRNNIIGTVGARGLAPLDWQKTMLGVTEELATQQGFTTIGLQAASKNKWIKIPLRGENRPHMTEEEAVKSYDKPAERLGFKKGNDDNWHKQVA